MNGDFVWMIVCSAGNFHPQDFQAGRADFGAYKTRREAQEAAARANRDFPGHRVVKMVKAGDKR